MLAGLLLRDRGRYQSALWPTPIEGIRRVVVYRLPEVRLPFHHSSHHAGTAHWTVRSCPAALAWRLPHQSR